MHTICFFILPIKIKASRLRSQRDLFFSLDYFSEILNCFGASL